MKINWVKLGALGMGGSIIEMVLSLYGYDLSVSGPLAIALGIYAGSRGWAIRG
jgi:hypothetical protein